MAFLDITDGNHREGDVDVFVPDSGRARRDLLQASGLDLHSGDGESPTQPARLRPRERVVAHVHVVSRGCHLRRSFDPGTRPNAEGAQE
ncbi:hypothetical protein [Mycolicibacterium llatzerense]|uniref:hypothetical protein n=1 Tax=Mycolicibacterium llatzerense TaxID=280871 RepID=UPI0010409DFF|nr:hypothetical protein [Mycolicibacterium llatzerense]